MERARRVTREAMTEPLTSQPVHHDAERSHVDLTPAGENRGWRYYLRAVGPGLVTGASDDDPSGIATYSQAGAAQGFGLLWTTWLTFPLMAGVQEICDRTALATGRSLGELVGDDVRVLAFPAGGAGLL